MLPCFHFFHAYRETEAVLSEARWKAFQFYFEGNGYYFYLKTITVMVYDNRAHELDRIVLDVRDCTELMRDIGFEFAEAFLAAPGANRDSLSQQWIELLSNTIMRFRSFATALRE